MLQFPTSSWMGYPTEIVSLVDDCLRRSAEDEVRGRPPGILDTGNILEDDFAFLG